MNYSLVDINKLRPLEKIFPSHLKNIKKIIEEDQEIKKAIIADLKTGTILDGSHRYAYLLSEGYQLAPVFWVDYQSEDIRVGTRLSHRLFIEESTGITKEECLLRSQTGKLYPPRTTRHFFTFRKETIAAPLENLKKGPKNNISYLISNTSILEEVKHNKNYISEIDEELLLISNYISEMIETKKYLKKQISMIEHTLPIGFFPGKFHPPHLGHLKTILNIAPRYKKLIIGISGDTPEDPMLTQNDIFDILESIFSKNKNIELHTFQGRLIDMKDISSLPKFDTIISGNPEVIEWAKTHGLKYTFEERSFNNLSSTYIRKL